MSGAASIRITTGRVALLCASLLSCIPATSLSQTIASPSTDPRIESLSAKRSRAPSVTGSLARRQGSYRKDGSKTERLVRKKAALGGGAAPAARRALSAEMADERGATQGEGAERKEARPADAHDEGSNKSSVCANRSELENIARTYCSNNIASAAEARVAWESKKLRELETEVARKSEALASLVQETRTWVERREKLLGAARDSLVEIYAKMRPEVAAQQLGTMSEDNAASIITKLNPRSASAILNEMSSERAARLADGVLRGMREKPAQEKSGS